MSGKNFCFPEKRCFKYEWLLLFAWHCDSLSEDRPCSLSCVLFALDFHTKTSWVKNLFSQPFQGLAKCFFYFRTKCEGKSKKIDRSHESIQSLQFSAWPKVEAIFS